MPSLSLRLVTSSVELWWHSGRGTADGDNGVRPSARLAG